MSIVSYLLVDSDFDSYFAVGSDGNLYEIVAETCTLWKHGGALNASHRQKLAQLDNDDVLSEYPSGWDVRTQHRNLERLEQLLANIPEDQRTIKESDIWNE